MQGGRAHSVAVAAGTVALSGLELVFEAVSMTWDTWIVPIPIPTLSPASVWAQIPSQCDPRVCKRRRRAGCDEE